MEQLISAMISHRWGVRTDIPQICNLLTILNEDIYQFILAEIAPTIPPRALIAHQVSQDGERLSFKRCLVAEQNGRVVGLANAFPARLYSTASHDRSLSERERLLLPVFGSHRADSFVIGSIIVECRCRGLGVGSTLVEAVAEHAKSIGFSQLTLHVWANNQAAFRFYQRLGFVTLADIKIDSHADLPRAGPVYLLGKSL